MRTKIIAGGFTLLFIALVTASCASTGQAFPTGEFVNEANFIHTFLPDGSWALRSPTGRVWIEEGRYSVEGDTVKITDELCKSGEGVYRWAVEGDELTFETVEDKCGERRLGLTPGLVRFVPQDVDVEDAPAVEPGETISSLNPVTTPDGDRVGESKLGRESSGIVLNFEACCVTPGNAYTAWWVIGDVTQPISAVKTKLASGWVAGGEEVMLVLELEAGSGGIQDPLDGIRIAVLDHGPYRDPIQLKTPEGGCQGSMCPVVLSTAHAAP